MSIQARKIPVGRLLDYWIFGEDFQNCDTFNIGVKGTTNIHTILVQDNQI